MKKWICLCLCLCLFFPIYLISDVNDRGDFQVWNQNALKIHLSQKAFLYGDVEFRYGDDASKLFYKHLHTTINWAINPHVTLSPGMRFIWNRRNKKWIKTTDPLFALTLFLLRSHQVVISNRHWVQLRHFPKDLGDKKRLLYRSQLKLFFPSQIGRFRVSPYLSNEIFWQEARGVFQNRAIFGLVMPRNQRAYFNLFYQYRNLKNLKNQWTYQHVLGLSALFLF